MIVFVYLPTVCITLASLTASRYFQFPIPKWGLDWWQQDLQLDRDPAAASDLDHASPLCVTVIAVVLAFFGALAFARYDWKGRSHLPEARPAADLLPAVGAGPGAAAVVQRARPAAVLEDGGLRPSRLDRAGGDAGDLDPGLQLRSGAGGGGLRSRRVALAGVARGDAAGAVARHLFSGALFAFLLSWGNFPLSLFTTGADTTVPEYLYAKMVAGYTPGVPVLGTVSTIGAALLLHRRLLADPADAPARKRN